MINLTHPVVDIAIICSNFEESLRFYHEVLGLEIAFELHISDELAPKRRPCAARISPGAVESRRHADQTGGDRIAAAPSFWRVFSGRELAHLLVEDIEQTIEQLKRNGVSAACRTLLGP